MSDSPLPGRRKFWTPTPQKTLTTSPAASSPLKSGNRVAQSRDGKLHPSAQVVVELVESRNVSEGPIPRSRFRLQQRMQFPGKRGTKPVKREDSNPSLPLQLPFSTACERRAARDSGAAKSVKEQNSNLHLLALIKNHVWLVKRGCSL